jgi:ribosomal protein S18 acetylase RimI-like enzyme
MVAHAAQPSSTFSGLRPLSLSRDLVSVANLIELAFAEDMDDSGRAAVREMRWLGRLSFMFGWLDVFEPQGEGMLPGFVWIEDNKVVGNATVRRLNAYARGWMIGNVAVAPDWRGRGIARSLMNGCIDLSRQRNAEWAALQVRSDNTIARGLYDSLGFRSIGETIEWVRAEADRPTRPERSNVGLLRAAQPRDAQSIFSLAQSAQPDAMRWLEPQYRSQFELGLDQRFIDFMNGQRVVWRVIEIDHSVVGAAMIKINRRTHNGRLGVWTAPAYYGQLEQTLVDAVLSELPASTQSIKAHLPSDHIAGCDALLARSFSIVRKLTSMRLDLQST